MPTYNYQCKSCDYTFEVFHSIFSTEQYACPECGTQNAKKLLSASAIIYKGSGFYTTDYCSPFKNATSDKATDKSPPQSPATNSPNTNPSDNKT